MKQYLLFPALLVGSILALCDPCGAQCPEDPNDLGFCDTLIIISWDEKECDSFPCLVHFSLLVTHDSNTFWWQGGNRWVQDSIAALVIPLKWTRNNPSAYCSLSLDKNIFSYADTVNGIFRHFGGKCNRMLDWYEMEKEWTVYYDINNSSQYWGLGLLAMQGQCQRWWEGDSVLLATFTFTISDTMTVCVDTTWFLDAGLWFTRYDATIYFPRHNPLCMTVKFFNRGDANGNGEVHIDDIVYLINYLFMGGPAPPALRAGDANCDAVVDVADVIYLINYLFQGGPPPGCP